MDTETLRGWVEEIKENPNPLKSLIREHLYKMSLPLSFITEPGITAGIEVSRTQGDAGCHGSGAP